MPTRSDRTFSQSLKRKSGLLTTPVTSKRLRASSLSPASFYASLSSSSAALPPVPAAAMANFSRWLRLHECDTANVVFRRSDARHLRHSDKPTACACAQGGDGLSSACRTVVERRRSARAHPSRTRVVALAREPPARRKSSGRVREASLPPRTVPTVVPQSGRPRRHADGHDCQSLRGGRSLARVRAHPPGQLRRRPVVAASARERSPAGQCAPTAIRRPCSHPRACAETRAGARGRKPPPASVRYVRVLLPVALGRAPELVSAPGNRAPDCRDNGQVLVRACAGVHGGGVALGQLSLLFASISRELGACHSRRRSRWGDAASGGHAEPPRRRSRAVARQGRTLRAAHDRSRGGGATGVQ